MVKRSTLALILALGVVNGHIPYWNTPNKLQPVHGLYVKPSVDGTTGDLYVAATEESGTKSQWLTEQPINFLPTSQSVPAAYSPNIIPTTLAEDPTNLQKRAIVNAPLPYTYAYPVPGPDGTAAMPYPYAIPTTTASTTETTTVNKDAPTTTLPQYPYSYLYPQMLSAYADMLNTFKEAAGLTEETGNTSTTQASPVWPYHYPVQYVMVDPTMWAQHAAAAAAVSSTSAPSTTTSSAASDEE